MFGVVVGVIVGGFLLTIASSGCVGDSTEATDGFGGFAGEILVEGLNGPTQLVVADDDSDWWVAQLAGGENDRSGQVLRIDPGARDAVPELMLEGLDKPTGLALFAGELWVMERDRLTRGPIGGLIDGSDRVVVIDQLPNNGRSQGTLTVDGDRLLYNTSGRLEDDDTPAPGSGSLWAVTLDAESGEASIDPIADGFKHAYAHVRSTDGTLYTTEIGDGRFDGQQPADELVAVVPGVDHGWPQCVGDNRLVVEYNEANGDCPDAPPSTALFPSGATPTSVSPLPAPFSDLLAVALWNTGEVVVVAVSGSSTGADAQGPTDYTVAYEGVERPQHLVLNNGRLLLTGHQAGTIVALTAIENGTTIVGS